MVDKKNNYIIKLSFKLRKDTVLKRYIMFDNVIHNKSIYSEYLSLLSRIIPTNVY